MALTAGTAKEAVNDKGPGGHSPFTWYVLQGLRGEAAQKETGVVTGSDLMVYVKNEVGRNFGSQQTPDFGKLPGHESGGDFIFRLPAAKPVLDLSPWVTIRDTGTEPTAAAAAAITAVETSLARQGRAFSSRSRPYTIGPSSTMNPPECGDTPEKQRFPFRALSRIIARPCTALVACSALRCASTRRDSRMKQSGTILLLVLGLLLFASSATAAPTDTVVGDGTAASCDGNELEAAVTAGGLVTFACGGPHTILANTMVVPAGTTTVLDGAGIITISGEDLRQIFIISEGASLTLNNITLEHGNWPGRGGAAVTYGTLTLNRSTVRDSRSDCQVCDGTDGIGGAIAVESTGALTIDNSELRNNWAGYAGGAVGLYGGSATITRSTIDENGVSGGSGGGGGLWANDGTALTLTDSRVTNNQAGYANAGSGGGLFNRGDATVERTTFGDNRANDAGAIHNAAGGSKLTVRQSTFSGNEAYVSGGAMLLANGEILLENSTVSGNTAHTSAGGIRFAVPQGAGRVQSVNVTVYGNTVVNVDNVRSNANLHIDAESEPPQLQNTLITGGAGGENCYLGVNPVSLGYNLASDASCGLEGEGDRQGIDLLLDTLKDNGGPTFTHLAFVGSPAVDAIPAAACAVTLDQRGTARPQGPNCDAGAVEGVPTTQPPLPISQPYYLGKLFVRPFNFPIFAFKPNIAATQLEVTQGIQEADGLGVTLVARKRTYVRFHVRKTAGAADPVVGARLWRIVGGQRVGDPLFPSTQPGIFRFVPFLLGGAQYVFDPTVTVRSTPDRNTLSDSFFFRLPDSWTAAGSLTVEAEVNPTFLSNALDEATRSDNTLRTTFSFVDTPAMVLRLLAVSYRNNGTVYTPSETQLREVEDWLRRAYPIARLVVKRDTEDMTNLNRIPTCDEVNGRLFWDNLFLKWAGIDPLPTRYFGLVVDGPGGTPFMRGCAADIPSFIASGPTGPPTNQSFANWDDDNDGESYGDWYTGHELAHTWGRSHVLCRGDEGGPDTSYPMGENGSIGRERISGKNKYWGFDVFLRGPIVYPPTWKDIMVYCDNQWISAYTYEAIRNRLVSENEAATAASLAAEPLADYLVVQGTVTPAGPSATLDQVYRLTAPKVLVPSAPGAYAIRLVDGAGMTLASYPFTPRVDTEDPDNVSEPQLVMEQVPFVAGTAKVQIVSGAAVLAQRTVSANAPTVAVTAPAGGETIDANGLTVSWTAADADGDALVATVLYSRDGGATYAPLRLHLTTATVVIPLDELGGTTQGKVRVLVSDGVNTGQADSPGFFTVPNQPPAAQIVTPAADEVFGYGQITPLTGVATDMEDVTLPDSAFQWSSDQDGVLGSGPALEVALETVGTHLITLQVTDAGSATGTATRTVVVSDDVMAASTTLLAAPPATNFVAPVASTRVQTQSLGLRNPAGDALTWQAAVDAPWLTVAPASGATPADPELRVNPAGLAVGEYKAVVTITPGGSLPAQKVRVTLTVMGATVNGQIYLPLIRR